MVLKKELKVKLKIENLLIEDVMTTEINYGNQSLS